LDIEGQLSVVPDDSDTIGKPDSPPGRVPPPRHSHTVRLLTDDGARVLYMFDATDDLGHGSEHPGRARTCVLVIDPVSADSFQAGMSSALQAEMTGERPNTPSPRIDYGKTLKQIKAMGIDSREVRLAVVFTRGDLVNSPHRKVVRWACRELGLSHLVSSVRRDFKDSRFFCVDTETRGHDVSLLRWLLIADGVAPARNRVVVDVREEEEISYRWHRRYVFAAVLGMIITVLALLFTSWLRDAVRLAAVIWSPIFDIFAVNAAGPGLR
jgi:hypothetical protein